MRSIGGNGESGRCDLSRNCRRRPHHKSVLFPPVFFPNFVLLSAASTSPSPSPHSGFIKCNIVPHSFAVGIYCKVLVAI